MNVIPYSNLNGSCADLQFAAFNQDCGCFVVGTKRGFRIFNSDPLKQDQHRHDTPPPPPAAAPPDAAGAEDAASPPDDPTSSRSTTSVVCAEMLFRCNYLAYVSDQNRRLVKVWDDLKKRAVISIEFGSEVRAVKLRRDRIVVVLEKLIKVRPPLCTHIYVPLSLIVFLP